MKPRKGLDGKFECYKNFSKNGEATPTRSIKMSLAYSMLLLFPTSRLFSHWSLSRPWESIGECAPRRRRRPSLHYSAFLSSIPLSLSPQSEMPILDKVFSITAAVSSHCSSSKQLRRLISNFHPLLHHISAFAFHNKWDILTVLMQSNKLLHWEFLLNQLSSQLQWEHLPKFSTEKPGTKSWAWCVPSRHEILRGIFHRENRILLRKSQIFDLNTILYSQSYVKKSLKNRTF